MPKDPKNRALRNNERKFSDLIISGEKNIDAHKEAYPKSKATNKTRIEEACKIRKKPHIAEYIRKGQEKTADMAQLTAADLIKELEEARQLGKTEMQPSAMVCATMGKAKLLGLDKVVIEIQNAEELTPWASVKAGVDK